MKSQDEQLRDLLTEAAGMLPEEAELDDFEIALGAEDYSLAMLALREAATPFPTSLKFWMLLSQAEDQLGGD